MGGTKCRPLRWDRNRAVFLRVACGDGEDISAEAEVRAKDFFGGDLFPEKVAICSSSEGGDGFRHPRKERLASDEELNFPVMLALDLGDSSASALFVRTSEP